MRVAIVVHGYPLEVQEEHRHPTDIWRSRLRAANRVAQAFSEETVWTIISGGGSIEGKSEAQHMSEYLYDKGIFEALEQTEMILEEDADTTYENITESLTVVEDINADIVVPVSDVDHTPRILYNWYQETGPNGPVVLVGSSYETYTDTDEEPLILEPGKLAPIIASFGEFWDIEATEYEALGEELADLFEKYTDKE